MRWVYLRKKSAEGPFDIYTDIDSRLAHYKRVNALWIAIAISQFMIGLSNILIGIMNLINFTGNSKIPYISFIFGFIPIALGFLLLRLSSPIRKKIKKLQVEKNLRE